MPPANTAPRWAQLLAEAVEKPGLLLEAYHRFRGYSLGNQVAALCQCHARNIQPGPIATLKRWNTLSRTVTKGQKALFLCMPITLRHKDAIADDTDPADRPTRKVYLWKPYWFVLAQTDGPALPPELPLPDWDKVRALATLGITEIPFDHPDGNTQGFALGRSVAVSPIAQAPWKTLFHEIGHILLGHQQPGADDADTPRSIAEAEAEAVALLCLDTLGLPGTEYARGYIQHWYGSNAPLPERSAVRIFKAADAILRAGEQPPLLM
ncbi:MAG TPA: hypothetical protein PLS53_11820 [Thermoanaerobaculaceae bacterium]|nr:hypothetical protein [Thermoanaerobaculaceae bacterium]HPS78835.1 hypothetical protein [Thermoanaerobaculaceae bacterium]